MISVASGPVRLEDNKEGWGDQKEGDLFGVEISGG